MTGTTEKLSKTQLSQQDKARRIREASRALFLSRGFEDATIRDIARMAEVAQGTLFLYASSKRDLLFMLYNDLIEAVANASVAIDPRSGTMMETLMRISLVHFQGFTDELAITRISLVNLNLYDESAEADRFRKLHGELLEYIENLYRTQIDNGTLTSEFPLRLLASMTFAILVEMLKAYIRADIPDIRRSMQDTCGQFTIMLRGLGAKPDMLSVQQPDIAVFLQ